MKPLYPLGHHKASKIIKHAISRTERAKTAPLLRYEPFAEEPNSRPVVVLLVVVAVFGVVLAALNSYYAQPQKPETACELLNPAVYGAHP